jgi:DNA-binding CsgD family transcriptional regulator
MSAVWDGAEGTGVRGHRPGLGPDLVRLSLEAGDLERARSTAELVADVAAAVDIDTVTGAALLCRGMVDGDRATMLDAVAVFRRGPRPVELAQACEHAGRVIGTQDAECSVALVREAIEVYEGVEAALDVARAESLLRRLGSRRGRRGRRGRPTTGWDSLTRAEMQVARHVSEGFTNPEIASRLYLSRYTVQTHLRHIFAKLNVSSRSEVAAEVTRRDASPDGPAIDRRTW